MNGQMFQIASIVAASKKALQLSEPIRFSPFNVVSPSGKAIKGLPAFLMPKFVNGKSFIVCFDHTHDLMTS